MMRRSLARERAAKAPIRARQMVETAGEVLACVENRAVADAELIQCMAQMIRDMGAEFVRAVSVMERVRDAHRIDSAHVIVREYLAELGR